MLSSDNCPHSGLCSFFHGGPLLDLGLLKCGDQLVLGLEGDTKGRDVSDLFVDRLLLSF